MGKINQGILGGFSGKVGSVGEYPDYLLNYPTLLVSRGGILTGASVATAQALTGKIELTWEDNSGIGEAQPTDKAMAVVINPAKGEAAYITDGAPRSSGQEELTVSPFWVNDEVEVYLLFISENGKDVATSTYCGSITVV
jgi:hypothetical protein